MSDEIGHTVRPNNSISMNQKMKTNRQTDKSHGAYKGGPKK